MRKNPTLHISDDDRLEFGPELQLLERYRTATEAALTHAITNVQLRERINIHKNDLAFINKLIHDPDITCKPADKNLGLVLTSTAWYDAELERMLKDRVTYKPYNGSVNKLKARLTSELETLVATHSRVLEDWQPAIFPQLEKFMKGKISADEMAIPGIYLLLKVHKPNLCGRPIVPCTKWITTPASILVDHLLQELLRDHPIPCLVKDTKSFVNEIERIKVMDKKGIFITADIASLYTNIDTQLGLELIEKFLIECKVREDRRKLIMDLLAFVMNNSYLIFKGQVYHQRDGTAMGTSCAPIYANIICWCLERIILPEFGVDLHLYRRFLDDVFAYLCPTVAERFMTRMNSLHPKLKFEFVVHPTEAAFLDLLIHKGKRFAAEGRFDLRVHQKKMNLYLYIPWSSHHPVAAKRSFIQTELMRYIRNTSAASEYFTLKHIFYQRLRDRGYPRAFLTPLFNSIWYEDRSFFLIPSDELQSHPLRLTAAPRSACLIKRLARADLAALKASSNDPGGPSRPPVFVIPFTPLSHAIPTRRILCQRWPLVNAATGLTQPIIAYQSFPSLLVKLIHQKARAMELLRTGPPLPKLIQPKLTFATAAAQLKAAGVTGHSGPSSNTLPSSYDPMDLS